MWFKILNSTYFSKLQQKSQWMVLRHENGKKAINQVFKFSLAGCAGKRGPAGRGGCTPTGAELERGGGGGRQQGEGPELF